MHIVDMMWQLTVECVVKLLEKLHIIVLFGCVVLQFAVKMITKKSLNSAREKFHIQREIDIQSKLHHPNVISVYEGLCGNSHIIVIPSIVCKATGNSRFESQKSPPLSVKIPENSRYENTAYTPRVSA